MKAISVLGTSSDAGKSWVATALCALLKRKGYNVAPFKAQNMSNNSYATLDGGEIGRAQAVQAEACGLTPSTEMNPVLLKPAGDNRSQLVLLGKAGEHFSAREYYDEKAKTWAVVENTLEWWKDHCDVLILEGAGSPVELNLMAKDIVNLKPIEHLDGKWLLVCDIEKGGVFAQAIGTYQLLPENQKERGLGILVNKFRGDLSLFNEAASCFAEHIPCPLLGTLPMAVDLQPESEDGFTQMRSHSKENTPYIAWIRLPRVSNSQDCQPWTLDDGISVRWIDDPNDLDDAVAIVLPGTKNTIEDLKWLKEKKLDQKIIEQAKLETPIIGICGGYQMLGQSIEDPIGIDGEAQAIKGLGLLPVETTYDSKKTVTQVEAQWENSKWQTYEIHVGNTLMTAETKPLLKVTENGASRPEGIHLNNVWGTYLHGLFESPAIRKSLIETSNINGYQNNPLSWTEHKNKLYSGMADLLEEHVDLTPVWKYLND